MWKVIFFLSLIVLAGAVIKYFKARKELNEYKKKEGL